MPEALEGLLARLGALRIQTRTSFRRFCGFAAYEPTPERTGTLVGATLIPSASIRRDDKARWAGHRRRMATRRIGDR